MGIPHAGRSRARLSGWPGKEPEHHCQHDHLEDNEPDHPLCVIGRGTGAADIRNQFREIYSLHVIASRKIVQDINFVVG